MNGRGGRDAHAFLEDLSDAIDAVVDELGGGPLHHRGMDLGPAIARRLFIELSNDARLAAGGPVAPATPMHARVATRLLGSIGTGPPSALDRIRTMVAAARVLHQASSAGDIATPARGGAWFVLEHPKFLTLMRPVAAALQQERPAVLWSSGDVRPPGCERDPALDGFPPARPPSLRRAGWAARELPDLIVELERSVAAVQRLAPQVVVICEGNGPHGAVVAAAARAAGVPVICLQQGWSPMVHTGFRSIPADRMCVWGEGFAELLAPHNPTLELAVTGSPVLEGAGSGVGAELAGLVDGRPAAAFFLQPLSPYIRPADQRALAQLAAEVARDVPSGVLLVRPHPGYPLEATKVAWPANVVFAGSDRFTLREVIEASRVVVSIYSTSLIEGAALGRPAVVFNPTDLPRYLPDLDALGAGCETSDPDEARAAIVALLQGEAAAAPYAAGLAAVRERYFAGLHGDAAARVAAVIARD